MKKLIGIFALFLAVMLLGCTGGGGGGGVGPNGTTVDDLSFVPESANSVVLVKVADVVSDATVKSKVDSLISQMPASSRKINLPNGKTRTYENLDGMFSIYEDEYGINPKSITRFIAFGDVMNYFGGMQTQVGESSTPYFGFIVRGTFNKEKILDQFKGTYELKESKYKDVTIYTQDTESASKPYLAFPDDNTFIIATENAVKDAIGAGTGGTSLKDAAKIMKVIGEINGDAWVVLATKVPSQIKESFRSGAGQYGKVDVSVFSKVDYFALSLNKNGGDIEAKSAMLAASSSAAGDISDELKTAKKAFVDEIQNAIDEGSVPSEYASVVNSLKKTVDEMSIETKEDVVVAGAGMPLEDIIKFSMFFFASSTTASPQKPSVGVRGLTSFGVTSLAAMDDGTVYLALQNELPDKIKVTEIKIGGSGSADETELEAGASSTLTVTGTGISGSAGEGFSESIEISYTNTESGIDHTDTGTISGTITSSG